MTRVLAATEPHLAAAVRALRDGQLVVLPTETVYGLGADALQPDAVAAVFTAKGRPAEDPLIVHVGPSWLVGSPAAALNAAGITTLDDDLAAEVDALAAAWWPGPLTLLLPRGPAITDAVTAGLPSVAVRVPDHPAAGALLDAFGGPVVAPSANRFGAISPTTAAAALAELDGRVALILDGGACAVGVESTVLRLRPLEILRPGAITPVDVEAVLGRRPVVAQRVAAGPLPAPGLTERHYAPSTPLVPLDGRPLPADDRVGLLAWSHASVPALRDALGPRLMVVEVLAPGGDAAQAARDLYAALRRLDASGCQILLAEPVPAASAAHAGLLPAVADRLRRASAPRE